MVVFFYLLNLLIIIKPNMGKTMKNFLCISIYYITYLFAQNTNVVQLTSILESGYS